MGQSINKVRKNMKTISFDYDNVAGCCKAYAIPEESFVALTDESSSGTATLVTTDPDGIVEVPTYANDLSFDENSSQTDHGQLYDVAVSGSIPVLASTGEDVLRRLECGRWLLLFQTRNGNTVLAGTKDVPLRFSRGRNVGPNADRTQFSFTAKEPEPSLYVSSSIVG